MGRLHGPSTAVYTAREQVTRVHSHYTAMYTACMGSLHGRVRAVNGHLDGRCAAAYGPCTRPCNVSCTRPCTGLCNVSCARYAAAREHVFAHENGPYTQPIHGRVWVHGPYTAVYGPCTRPVYTTRVHDCVRAVCTDVFGRVHGAYTARTRDVYTAVYGPCSRPCTRHVYGRVYVSPCLRPCTGHLQGRKRPSTRLYTAV